MRDGEGAQFETIVERRALWSRIGWVIKAFLAGGGSLLLVLAVVGGVLEIVSPLPPGSPAGGLSWPVLLALAVGAALLARMSVQAITALAAGTREIEGPITQARVLSHSGQRVNYTLWHVVVDGQEFTFSPRELRGTGASWLRPGQRVVVRVVGVGADVELVRLAVDTGARCPPRAVLSIADAAPAPLSAQEISRVTAWAARQAGVPLALAVGLLTLIVSRGGPVNALHAIFAVIIGALLWASGTAARKVLAARALAPGTATRYLHGALRQSAGLLRDTFLDGQRLGDAGVPRAPRLATTARARVVTLPVPDQHHPETLVAVEWVEALD